MTNSSKRHTQDWDVLPNVQYRYVVTAHLSDGMTSIPETEDIYAEHADWLDYETGAGEIRLNWVEYSLPIGDIRIYRDDSGTTDGQFTEVDTVRSPDADLVR